MIVWLASYPRSGATLVRMILSRCFDVKVFDRQPAPPPTSACLASLIGDGGLPEDWDSFHGESSSARTNKFIKTHLPPEDTQPCIYVLRDGRDATLSYSRYVRQFFPQEQRTLMELVFGQDYFGDWTTHFRSWNPERRDQTLILRYEALIATPDAEIARIANFIGRSVQRKWRNPFPTLHAEDPLLFHRGGSPWEPDPTWTRQIEDIFQMRHGRLMRHLGYGPLDAGKDFVNEQEGGYRSFLRDLDAFAATVDEERGNLERIADERNLELAALSAEAERRQARIEELRGVMMDHAAALEKREQVIADIANERLAEMNRLTEAVRAAETVAAERQQLVEQLQDGLADREKALAAAHVFEEVANERLAGMNRLTEAVRAAEAVAAERLQLVGQLQDGLADREQALAAAHVFEEVANERLAWMNRLTESVRAAERVAGERFADNVRLGNECARRLDVIREQEGAIATLHKASAERLASMIALRQDADDRLALIQRLDRELRGKHSSRSFIERCLGAISSHWGRH